MRLAIRELHAGPPGQLNQEWFLVENVGDSSFNTNGCTVSVARKGQRPRALGVIEPGFVIKPGEKVRIVTGSPGKKAHGPLPDESVRMYSLFREETLLPRPGTVVVLSLRQLEIARATFDPTAPTGLANEAPQAPPA